MSLRRATVVMLSPMAKTKYSGYGTYGACVATWTVSKQAAHLTVSEVLTIGKLFTAPIIHIVLISSVDPTDTHILDTGNTQWTVQSCDILDMKSFAHSSDVISVLQRPLDPNTFTPEVPMVKYTYVSSGL